MRVPRGLLLALALGLPESPAQEGTDRTDAPGVLRVDTRLVQVDVVVLDDDEPVGNLTAEDFTIFDDGVPREVEVFTVTRSNPPDAAPAPLSEGVVSNRIDWRGQVPESATVILMDRFNTLGMDQPFMDHQAKDFLDDAVKNNDRVAVYELSDAGLALFGDYRTPPERIRRALDGARPRHALALESSLGALDDVQMDQQLAAFTGDENAATPFETQVADYYVQLRALNTSAALEAIAGQLAGLPGRKNLVWLASSFPFTFNPHQNPHLYRATTFSARERIDEVSRLMTDANVAIYPVDVRGLMIGGEPTELSIMTTLADMTGGRASYNTNGLANAMRQAVRDAEITYTLGFYVTEAGNDTSFHELEVRMDREDSEDLDVRHRRGYYGFGGEEPPLGDRPGLDEALASAFDAASLGLLATAGPSETTPGAYDLVVAVDVDDLGLSRQGDRWVGSLTSRLLFYAVSQDGQEAGRLLPVETYPVVLDDRLLESARATGFILHRRIETGGQIGHLRVVVADAGTGAIGSLWVPLGID